MEFVKHDRSSWHTIDPSMDSSSASTFGDETDPSDIFDFYDYAWWQSDSELTSSDPFGPPITKAFEDHVERVAQEILTYSHTYISLFSIRMCGAHNIVSSSRRLLTILCKKLIQCDWWCKRHLFRYKKASIKWNYLLRRYGRSKPSITNSVGPLLIMIFMISVSAISFRSINLILLKFCKHNKPPHSFCLHILPFTHLVRHLTYLFYISNKFLCRRNVQRDIAHFTFVGRDVRRGSWSNVWHRLKFLNTSLPHVCHRLSRKSLIHHFIFMICITMKHCVCGLQLSWPTTASLYYCRLCHKVGHVCLCFQWPCQRDTWHSPSFRQWCFAGTTHHLSLIFSPTFLFNVIGQDSQTRCYSHHAPPAGDGVALLGPQVHSLNEYECVKR